MDKKVSQFPTRNAGIDPPFAKRQPPAFTCFTEADLNKAKLHPRCFVTNLLYADLGEVAAPGGVGKTTMMLYESALLALKRPIWGCEVVNPGKTLIITAEDSADLIAARLREILDAMNLSPADRQLARESIAVWDVSGEMLRLAELDGSGNLNLTDLADSIVDAYRDAGIAQVIFDPVVSFGPGERVINDGEQAIVTACRRIVRGLNCCVRLVHHTGKANARNGAIDQYAGRNGSALPDGCRMVTVLSSIRDTQLSPPESFEMAQGDSAFVYARAKLSYAPPQPNIWVRRRGFAFEYWIERQRSADEIIATDADKIAEFLEAELLHDRKYTPRALEAATKLKIPRKRLRDALAVMDTAGRVVERNLPDDERRGARKTYLALLRHCAEPGQTDGAIESPGYCAAPAEQPGAIEPPMPDPMPDTDPAPETDAQIDQINPENPAEALFEATEEPCCYCAEADGAIETPEAPETSPETAIAPTLSIAPPYRNTGNGAIEAVPQNPAVPIAPKNDGAITAQWRNKGKCVSCYWFTPSENETTGSCGHSTCSAHRQGSTLVASKDRKCKSWTVKAGLMEKKGEQHGY